MAFLLTDARKALEPVLEPVFDYGRALRIIDRPDLLASRILADEVDLGAMSKFFIAAGILGGLIGKMLPDESGGALSIDVPIIGDLVTLLMLLGGGWLGGIMFFWPLRWAGGTGTLRHTVMACAYVGGALYPIIIFMSGLVWQVFHSPLPNSVAFGVEMGSPGPLLATIHHLPRGRVALVAGLMPAAVVIIALIVAFFVFQLAPPAAQPPGPSSHQNPPAAHHHHDHHRSY